MSQGNRDKLTRRKHRVQVRTAEKKAKRQSKVAAGRDLQGWSLTDFMQPIILQFQQSGLPLLAFLAAIFVFYFPALSGEFIWDDVFFHGERAIHSWSGLWSIWFAPSEMAKEGHYWPITYTTFWLEHKLFGLNPVGHHIVNCLLYFTSVVLIWRLLLKLEVPGAWAISMIFTVHPLHVESVAWLIERKGLLSALFYLGAVHVWLRFRESPSLKTYALALGLYALGLLSKSTVVTLPAALLVLLWWKQERISAQDIMRVLPFFIVGFTITLGDYLFYVTREELDLAYSFLERVLIAAQAVWFYVGKLLWPANLMVIYPHFDVSVGNLVAWLFVAATVGVLILLWGCRHRIGKGPLAGVAFFVITLSPILSLVDYGYMQFSFVADRYQYLAGLGLMAVLVGGAIHAIQPYITSFRCTFMGTFAVLVIGLGILTWQQATIYQDGITFFRHIIAHNPTARDAYLNLAYALSRAGRIEESYEASLKAIELQPNKSMAHANFAATLIQIKRYGEAEESLKRALELDPKNAAAWQNYGSLHSKRQHYEKAYEANLKAVELQPNKSTAHSNAARVLILMRRYDEAEESLKRALELNPGNEAAWQNYGSLYLAQQRYEKAVAAFQKALDLNSDSILAHGGIADSYYRLGHHTKAMEWIDRALALNPPPSVRDDLSKLSARMLPALDKAEERLKRALKLNSRNAAAWQNYGSSHLNQQRYEEAVAAFRKAIDLSTNSEDLILAHGGIADSYYRLGHHSEAMEWIRRAQALNPAPSVQGQLSKLSVKVLLALGKTEEAEQHLLQADQRGDSDHEIWRLFELQKLSAKQGDTDKANVYLQRILKLVGDKPETLQSVADTLREQKQYAKAIEIYKKILAIDLDFSTAHAGMGDALFRLGRYEEAIESLERSVELHAIPSLAATHLLMMGQAAGKLGRSMDAAQYYKRAVEFDSQNTSALEHLAVMRFGEKRYEDALRLFTALRDNHSGDAQTHSNIGATLYHLGRIKEAIHSYETALSLDPSMKRERAFLEQMRRKLEEQE